MAKTNVPFGDDLAVQVWTSDVYIDKYAAVPLGVLDANGIIFTPDEIKGAGQAGDLVTVGTFGKLDGPGRGEDETLVNHEEALRRGKFQMTYGEHWHAVKVPSPNNIKQRRLNTDLSGVAGEALVDFMLQSVVHSIFNQAAGNYAESVTINGNQVYSGTALQFITGFNTVNEVSPERIIRPGGKTDDADLISTDVASLDLLDEVSAVAGSTQNTVDFGDSYAIGFFSPGQILQLKRDAGSSIQWYVNAGNYAAGGDTDDLKLGTMFGRRPLTIYNNIAIYESKFVPQGVDDDTGLTVANTRRAIILGQNAIMYGSPDGGTMNAFDDGRIPLIMANEVFDYGRWLGIGAGNMMGVAAFSGYSGVGNIFIVSTYATR